MSNFVYLLTILHKGNDFSYSSCIFDFDETLKNSFEEGYLIANRMYLFFSDETFVEIEEKLELLKENNKNYSYSLVDITEQVLENKFKLNLTQTSLSDILLKLLNDFKQQHKSKTIISKKTTEDLSIEQRKDLILDKINISGINSLSKEELEILNDND